jgi:hypothetical protein
MLLKKLRTVELFFQIVWRVGYDGNRIPVKNAWKIARAMYRRDRQ